MGTWKAYKQVQKDNTRRYHKLTKDQQKYLQIQGYKNSGNANVKKSRALLDRYYPEVQEQEPECKYYVVVTDKDTNIVLYADFDWYIWTILWPKARVSFLESYESAAEVAEEVGMYAIVQNLPWKIEIQREIKITDSNLYSINLQD